MNLRTINASLQHQNLIGLPLVLLISFLIVCSAGIMSSIAQSTAEERKFENTVPNHIPIKVKLKNEQSFKATNNKRWERDLEIEVKNTGNKPIYFLCLFLILPDVTIGGYPYALQINYGRMELVRFTNPIQPDDVPILPGESVILKVSEDQVRDYEESRDKEQRPDAKKVRLDFQLINFGDGTGLHGTDGRAIPDPKRKRALNCLTPNRSLMSAHLKPALPTSLVVPSTRSIL